MTNDDDDIQISSREAKSFEKKKKKKDAALHFTDLFVCFEIILIL